MTPETPPNRIDPSEASTLIRALCDEGYRRWQQCLGAARGGDENLVILQTYYHILEQIDAIGLLVGAGAVEPSKLQLRAAFEALLTLEYVLQTDTRRRAYAWLVVADIIERIRTWKRFDPSTDSGKSFAQLVKAEGHDSFPLTPTAGESKASLQKMLETDPRWTEAYEEYVRVKARIGKRPPEWYELFGGPPGPGLRNLALYLEHGSYYEIIYRLWSRRMHGTDVVQRVKPGSTPGSVLIEPRRYAGDIDTVLNYTISFGLLGTRLLVRHYLPDQWRDVAQWYFANIQSKWPLVPQAPPLEAELPPHHAD